MEDDERSVDENSPSTAILTYLL